MKQPTHPRWTDEGFAPTPGGPSGTYSGTAAGPIRYAELRDRDGDVMGYMWTDGKKAAGLRKSQHGLAVEAGSYVYRVHARMLREGRPASDVLNTDLYAPLYSIGPVKTADRVPDPGNVDNAIRNAARR